MSVIVKQNLNQLGQVIGAEVPDWRAPSFPTHDLLTGQYCRVEPLEIACHGIELFESFVADEQGKMWTYLPYGPFENVTDFTNNLEKLTSDPEQQFYAIVDLTTKRALGVAAYLRINPSAGSIEIGHLSYSPSLQRTTLSTEVMYLMMRKIFVAGYRRYEWKCNSLNKTSITAAQRLGFKFEGIFRQALVVDGCNRDTAWYSIIDSEWPSLKTKFESWLSTENFDQHGRQSKPLNEF